jgi:hypothetical protein
MYDVAILLIEVTKKKKVLAGFEAPPHSAVLWSSENTHTYWCSVTIFRGAGLHCCVRREATREDFSVPKSLVC